MIISIINNKGGVGKTTTCVNLAHALSRLGKKILVVDMDAQSNATSILLEDKRNNSLYEILDPYEEEIKVENCICGSRYENLYIVPNIPETATLEPLIIKKNDPTNLYIFRRKIREFAKKNFDITLIDNPPNLGTFVILSLRASDLAIVPNEAGSKHSVDGLIKAVKFIEEEREGFNQDIKFLKLLITKVDRRLSIHKAIISQINNFFPEDKIFKTIIPLNTAVQNAETEDKSLFEYQPNANAAKAYMSLAKELVKTLK